jgi:hypothetical protein
MSKFLKLSTRLINVRNIERIGIREDSFKIHVTNNSATGFMIYGSGYYSNDPLSYIIDRVFDPEDFRTVKKFIKES